MPVCRVRRCVLRHCGPSTPRTCDGHYTVQVTDRGAGGRRPVQHQEHQEVQSHTVPGEEIAARPRGQDDPGQRKHHPFRHVHALVRPSCLTSTERRKR